MKLYENESSICHPWDTVMIANQKKYPNDLASHVVSIDVLSQEVDPSSGTIRISKLLGLKQKAPQFLNRLFGLPSVLYFLEESEINPKLKTSNSKTTNIDFRSLAILTEHCKYVPGKQDPALSTIYTHKASMSTTACELGGYIGAKLEDFALSIFKNNTKKGRELLESVLAISESEKSAPASNGFQ